jgi:cell division protein FtsN
LPPAAPRIPDPLSRSLYRIQVGSFLGEKNAAAAFNRVQAAGFSPVYERYGDYYRVVLTGLKAAYIEGITRRLGAAGFQDVLVSEER